MSELEQLKKENKRLQSIIDGLDKSARMLVRRDLELRRANEELESLDKAKSEFVSIAAHQLRTPLSAIRWAHQMLLDNEMGDLNSEQTLLLKQSQLSIHRLINLVNDLLNADHLEFGQVSYYKRKVNLVMLIKKVLEQLKPMADERDITLTDQVSADPAPFECDPEKFTEALSNLVNNAIKYTPASGKVSVALERNPETYQIAIADSGIGIPKIDAERMFHKFSRADNAKRVDADGSGLGLFITKKILEAHDCSIRFESEEGIGTIFYISAPVNA